MYMVLNNRGQQYGPLFKTQEKAQKWLEKKITSPIARAQFCIEKT